MRLSSALVCNPRARVASRALREAPHRFAVIDQGDIDESHRFHAYSQRRFIEDPIVQHRFLFLIADIFCFHSGSDGDDSLIGS